MHNLTLWGVMQAVETFLRNKGINTSFVYIIKCLLPSTDALLKNEKQITFSSMLKAVRVHIAFPWLVATLTQYPFSSKPPHACTWLGQLQLKGFFCSSLLLLHLHFIGMVWSWRWELYLVKVDSCLRDIFFCFFWFLEKNFVTYREHLTKTEFLFC